MYDYEVEKELEYVICYSCNGTGCYYCDDTGEVLADESQLDAELLYDWEEATYGKEL